MSITVDTIIQIVKDNHEPDQPLGAIMAYLRARNGKQLTARDLPKLQAIDPTVYIDKRFGRTAIDFGGYSRSQGHTGGSLTIAQTEGAPVIDMDYIVKANPAYFDEREKRNASRAAILDNPQAIEQLASTIEAFQLAKSQLETLLDHGGPFDADRYGIIEAFKLRTGI